MEKTDISVLPREIQLRLARKGDLLVRVWRISLQERDQLADEMGLIQTVGADDVSPDVANNNLVLGGVQQGVTLIMIEETPNHYMVVAGDPALPAWVVTEVTAACP